MAGSKSRANGGGEQHRHPLHLPLVPNGNQSFGVLKHLCICRTPGGRFLFSQSAAIVFHFTAIKAHGWQRSMDVPTVYTKPMCGRSTYNLTWEEIVRLYRLTLDQPPQNTRARYNVYPTTQIDTVASEDGKRRLVPMRWGLIPNWWRKPLKEMKLATFNARAETVAEKPMFRSAFKRTRCLIPVSGYYEWQDSQAASSLITLPDRTGNRLQSPACGMSGTTNPRTKNSNPAPW
jgi:SOS response associated peptidase (SRAP)